MTAVKTVSRTVVQKSSRTIEDNGKAKRNLAPGPIFTGGFLPCVGSSVTGERVSSISYPGSDSTVDREAH